MDSAGTRYGPLVGFCEHGNESSGSIKKAGYYLTSWVTISFSKNMLHRGVSKYTTCIFSYYSFTATYFNPLFYTVRHAFLFLNSSNDTCNGRYYNIFVEILLNVAVRFTDYILWPVPIQNQLLKLWILSDVLVVLLGRGIGPSKGLYLHRTAQHSKRKIYIDASSGIGTQDPSVRAIQKHTSCSVCDRHLLCTDE
jgi:hypothetical protein